MKIQIKVLRILIFGLFFYTQNLLAQGQVYTAKIEVQDLGEYEFSEFGTAYFVDRESVQSNGFHQCTQDIKVVSTNSLFINKGIGTEAKLQIMLKFQNENYVFKTVTARLVGRDYFSGSAILSIDERNLESLLSSHGYRLWCAGLNSGGQEQYYLGFQYFNINFGLYQVTKNSSVDRGFNGALLLDSSKKIPVGQVIRDYWSSKGNKTLGFVNQPLLSIRNYVQRIFRNQTQSSLGSLVYQPEEEQFIFKTLKDSLIIRPENDDPNKKVIILGSPEEVMRFSGSNEYSRRSRSNAFSGLRDLVGSNSRIVLNSVDGQKTPDWNSAVNVISNLPERAQPIINYSVYNSENGSEVRFLSGNRQMEYISLIRWIAHTGKAILDLDKNGTVRDLENKERGYLLKISSDLNTLFKTMETYDESYVMTMSHREKANYFSSIDKTVQNIKMVFFSKDSPEGEFRMESKTMYSIQSWLLDIEKWIATQRGSLGRSTIQNREIIDTDGN